MLDITLYNIALGMDLLLAREMCDVCLKEIGDAGPEIFIRGGAEAEESGDTILGESEVVEDSAGSDEIEEMVDGVWRPAPASAAAVEREKTRSKEETDRCRRMAAEDRAALIAKYPRGSMRESPQGGCMGWSDGTSAFPHLGGCEGCPHAKWKAGCDVEDLAMDGVRACEKFKNELDYLFSVVERVGPERFTDWRRGKCALGLDGFDARRLPLAYRGQLPPEKGQLFDADCICGVTPGCWMPFTGPSPFEDGARDVDPDPWKLLGLRRPSFAEPKTEDPEPPRVEAGKKKVPVIPTRRAQTEPEPPPGEGDAGNGDASRVTRRLPSRHRRRVKHLEAGEKVLVAAGTRVAPEPELELREVAETTPEEVAMGTPRMAAAGQVTEEETRGPPMEKRTRSLQGSLGTATQEIISPEAILCSCGRNTGERSSP
jgi:hypothetical protein